MALAQSAKIKLGTGNVPYKIAYDLTAAAADTGAFTLTHNEGIVAESVRIEPTAGTAYTPLNHTRASLTANAVVLTLGAAVPAGGFGARVYIEFNSMDGPADSTIPL